MSTSRRRFLIGATAGTGLAVAGTALPAIAEPIAGPAAQPVTESAAGLAPALRVGPGAGQYPDLVRGVNLRWVGNPDEVWVARTADDVVAAVGSALRTGRRVAVRSGGHCFEDFATGDVRVLIDVSGLDTVDYDPGRRAFAVGAGATLGEVYTKLFKGWGVTIPGGSCPTVGVGGHIAGGGYGPLNRLHGLVVDHLYAVEVVVAGRDGRARKVVATREADDPNRDLWWAHTGGGGGNFGVVTRYWFRSKNAGGSDPTALLPKPPRELLVSTVIWPWARLDQAAFVRLVRNFTGWFAANNAPGSPLASVYAHLATFHSSGGAVALNVQIDAGLPNADRQLDAFLAAVDNGVGVAHQTVERSRLPWLLGTRWSGFADRPTGKRIKGKSAMHRGALSERAATALYANLTRADYTHPGSGVLIAPYGGEVTAAAPGATASVHRDSAITLLYVSEWTDPAQDGLHIDFQRRLYRDVYATTGGVPVPGAETSGAYVNYADADLLDPAWNTSGVPWSTLYYRDAYPRLLETKARWDPNNVFHHRMSIGGGRR
ncbi:FAD-binding protein [Actinokineospora sp. NBRC 105648]|uniref:FAD-binding oxidoreductase n=1 Tax=Actinokineospora sp. NBRC 105648 TaxID=3032206 RepID=UPI0024A465E6|nr:FAD-binding protein [Actinokineospora sp. NBRC 105648]GLZ42521.1 FAD-linked oxidase [Actinokineospora sp. NBRC 105648]